MKKLLSGLALLLAVCVAHAADPLPSWRDTAPKKAVIAFVTGTTLEGGTNFVPMDQRIAVFDMDGTLIVERPVPAAVGPLFAELKQAIAKDPSLKDRPAIAALLKGDLPAVAATGDAGAADIIAAITGGRTVEEAAEDMLRLINEAKNSHFRKPYTDLAYQPMLELLSYLRANGFQIWICSGSPVVFTRQFSQRIFGVPPQQVMGTSVKTQFAERDGRTVLIYQNKISQINDKEGKPPTINLAIGLRPVFVGGNVGNGGDIAMMRYSKDRQGPSFQLLINHDDAIREFAYGEKDNFSLDSAKKYGFTVVNMKSDWGTLFAFPWPQ